MRAAPQLPSSFAASSKQRRMTSCGPAKVPPPGPDQLLPSYNSALAISRPKSMGLIAPQAGGHGGGTVTNPGFPTKHWRRTIYISKAFCGLSVSRGLPCQRSPTTAPGSGSGEQPIGMRGAGQLAEDAHAFLNEAALRFGRSFAGLDPHRLLEDERGLFVGPRETA